MRKNYRKRKFNRKRKNTLKIFFLILVGMTVGFAAINTTLQLIGTLNISRTTWNIHWENPTKTGGVTATQDVHLKNNDNTTVEYQVNLANQGDFYEFTVDAKNDGTIDAMITDYNNKVYENNVEIQKPDYLDFIVTYADGTTIANNHLLASTKKETYKVKVEYKTGLTADELPTSTRNLKFTFSVTYMQADESTQIERIKTYSFRDSPYEFVVPKDGTYKIELWGAQGGGTAGGKGAYTSGNIALLKGEKLYVYVGNKPTLATDSYNGGGNTNNSYYPSHDGGGATDVRLVNGAWDNFEGLASRIMVAGAGGGSVEGTYGSAGGYAGGLTGGTGSHGGNMDYGRNPTGGTQTTGGLEDNNYENPGFPGTFGKGGNGELVYGGGAGGSGYYGGGGGGNYHHVSSGAGGSSFISGYPGCNAIAESSTSNNIIHTGQPNHYNNTKVFTNSIMIDGAGCNWSTGSATNCGANQPQPDETMAIGHSGDGYAKITLIN